MTDSLVVAADPEVVFDYLVDPRNRAQWQSSLARVEDVVGEVGVGQRWVDVTSPGLRPVMETTEYDRPYRWTERGTWRGFTAELTLVFEPVGQDCRLRWTMGLAGRGVARPIAAVLNRLAPLAVRSDLRRAGAILSRPHRA
ncbi:SRPBCC family protein [Nocardioides sp.]|uniref:SRPBCC family protein n=1 Tax=Nocardioides sp. TaxID=35761 RepID=UPI0035663D43